MKKFIVIIGIFMVMLCVLALPVFASSYKDVSDGMYYTDSVEKLTTYGIISGSDGYFRPDANLTRAEFAKVTALVAGLEDSVFNNMSYKKFDDVEADHWSTGFVNTVAENRLIVGYTDGSFKPEKNVTYAEALTVILRTLDYTSADLGDNWPFAYITKANALGLTENLSFDQNDSITRANLCVIIDRALRTELNKSSNKLISKLDVTVSDEVLLIATKNEDSSLAIDEVKTSIGTYKLAYDNLEFSTLSKSKLILNDESEIIGFEDVVIPKKQITSVERIVDNEIYFDTGSSAKRLGITDTTYVYNDGLISNYGAQKALIEEASAVAFLYDKAGNIEYLVVNDVSYTEAVTIRSDIYAALNSVGVSKDEIDNARVYRDGYLSSTDEAQVFDVAYFNRANSTIYLYSDRISGTYNKAFPNKANVTSIEVGGSTFEIETQLAANKLGEKSGSYKIGSRITLLLGKDGKIADVVDLSSSVYAEYGLLLDYGIESSDEVLEQGKQERYITVLNGEGKTVKFKTKTNFENRIGLVGKVTVDDQGYAVFSTISSPNVVSGKIDKTNKKIGDIWLTSDCVVVERIVEDGNFVSADVVDFDDIIPDTLSKNNVIHAVKSGDFGDIAVLFVENVTETQYTYGVVTKTEKNKEKLTGVYYILVNGEERIFSTNYRTDISAGTAVALTFNNNQITLMNRIPSIYANATVSVADSGRIKVGKDVYRLHDNVLIINKSRSGYISISKYDIEDIVGKSVNLYSSGVSTDDDVVRVITVNE